MMHARGMMVQAAIATVALAAASQGQQPVDLRRDLRQSELKPIEQGVADVNPLATSQRIVEPGLGVPTGFREVYPVPGNPGWLMRANGGLYAVFPASVYSERGAEIPPDTTFYIGAPFEPEWEKSVNPALAARSTRLINRIDPFARRGAGEQAPRDDQDGAAPRPTIAEDGVYRRTRLISLIRAAAEQERRREQSDD